MVLQCADLDKRFQDSALDVHVLRGVNLHVHAGETLAVVGAAGLVAAILTLLVALRPSRADVEAGAAREALDAGPSGAAR